MGALSASLVEIKDFGSNIARPNRRFVACNFLSKVVIAQPDIAPITWDAMNAATLAVPGLPRNMTYRGVNAFQGFLILWQGQTFKWSDQNDFTTWIPVGSTASSFVFVTADDFTLGAYGTESDYILVDRDPSGLVSGQFLRIDTDPLYTFFKVGTVLPTIGQTATASGFNQTIVADQSTDLFLQSFVPFVKDERLYFAGSPTALLKVVRDAVSTTSVGLVVASEFSAPAVGSNVTVAFTSSTAFLPPGIFVSVGASAQPGNDVYRVESVDVNSNQAVLRRMGVGSSGATAHLAGEFLVTQPSVSVKNISGVTASSSFAELVKEAFAFTVIPQDLTGNQDVGHTFPAGTQILTVDANAAGELINAGALINGPILHFDTLGEQGYIFKQRSIQSVQYLGGGAGTFFIRPAITDEGLVGDYAFVKVGNDEMYFWGNRGVYRFLGGNNLQPIAPQYFKQLKAELDVTRADRIVGYHNEQDFEIWFIFPQKSKSPTLGSTRVFIYNYLENSCTIDDYPSSFVSLTAAARVNWNEDLIWSNTLGTWETPISFTVDTTWAEEASDNEPTQSLLGHSKNAPPGVIGMTPQAAYDLYYAAHPTMPPIPDPGDPLKFLVALNAYWQANGSWPSLVTIKTTGNAFIADAKILIAFNYVESAGIPDYFLGSAPSSTPGIVTYDNGENSRNGDPVLCQYESVDYDGGDPLAWKYADTQWFSIQTKAKLSIAMPLLVFIGTKENFDDDITWSAPIVLMVEGNKNYVTKTNVKASGRYFRLRLRAATAGLNFRISQVRILGRKGNTY